jgi:hypothetical protein
VKAGQFLGRYLVVGSSSLPLLASPELDVVYAPALSRLKI